MQELDRRKLAELDEPRANAIGTHRILQTRPRPCCSLYAYAEGARRLRERRSLEAGWLFSEWRSSGRRRRRHTVKSFHLDCLPAFLDGVVGGNCEEFRPGFLTLNVGQGIDGIAET